MDIGPMPLGVTIGRALPLGATPDAQGCNFALYSPDALKVELLLFDTDRAVEPYLTVTLLPGEHKSFLIWHCHVAGTTAGTFYAYRVHGPEEPWRGMRFDPGKLILDPYARGISKTLWRREDACRPGDNQATSLRGIVVDIAAYDWEGDRLLTQPMTETIIYEMHVGGFTRAGNAGVAHPGTFSAVVEKIPYLRSLGVTAVEFLPVFAFDDWQEWSHDGRTLRNHWGYSTMAFFAPHAGYCVSPDAARHVTEFRDMVKALHRAGIAVILDVVFNHTDEGNEQGPVFSFKGLANDTYYHLEEDRRYYENFSGCGNSVKANHPVAAKMIVDCLRYWVKEMHVDGFRFDEASVLSRDESGVPVAHPPVLWQIELDEVLAETKIIAEAWDAAGLYQVGRFPGLRWADWNGRFRDDVRRFVRGDPGMVCAVANRICGSADLYQAAGRHPVNTVNFVDAHDGFTLADLVAYDSKHNGGNGEENRDGVDDNLSWNCGVEGETQDPAIEALRLKQIRNFASILLLSQGVPMFVMGDEVRRSQSGNNNAWCQDNPLAWFDWSLPGRNAALLRFWSLLISFRRRHAALRRGRHFDGRVNDRGVPDIAWHGTVRDKPDWREGSRSIAFTMAGLDGGPDLHVILNMYWETLSFALPQVRGRTWRRAVDTALTSPADIVPDEDAPAIAAPAYEAQARSVVILMGDYSNTVRMLKTV